MKKTASILLAALLILSFIPSALAEESGDAAEAPEPIAQEAPAEEQDIAEEEKEPAPDAPETEEPAETAAEPAEEEAEVLPAREAGGEDGTSLKAARVRINATNFPDSVIREYVSENCDTDGDGYLSTDEINAVTVFDVSHNPNALQSGYLTYMTGVEVFTNLKELYCSYNMVRELDVSSFPKLEILECGKNWIAELDLSHNPLLKSLNCEKTQITKLDLSGNPSLQSLTCKNCTSLTKLALTGNTALQTLDCSGCQLTALDLRKNTALETVDCSENRLTSLQISGCAKLNTMTCRHNRLSALSLSGCTALDILYAEDNQLAELDLSGCPNLLTYYRNGEFYLIETTWYFCYSTSSYYAKITVDIGVSILPKQTPTYPVITQQPKDQKATAGKTVSLTVAASGSDLSYRWQVSKDGGKTWSNCSTEGWNQPTFSFTFKAGYAGWKYRCMVYRRTDGLASSAATLYMSPTVSKQPTYVEVTQGEKAVFQVTAAGGGLTYQWQVSKDDGKTWKNCSSTGYNTRKLSFTAKYTYGGWRYRCVIKNPAGTVTTDSALLMVLPTVSEVAGQTVLAGEKAVFTVQASGDNLTYQWTVSKDGGKTWKNCTSTGYNTATLRFTAKTSYSGWQYSCLVTNHRCMVSTNAATLTVLPADTAPVILEGPADQTVTAGKKATFRVEAAGSGLTYQWQVNKTGTWKNCTSAGFDQPEFSFTAKTSYSGWKYRCVIKNQYGTTRTETATLSVNAAS